jgi:hypothetical protein
MRCLIFPLFCIALLGIDGCSGSPETPVPDERAAVPAGEKATVGQLTYTVVDSQILTQLGQTDNPRIPNDRFMMVQLAVTNSGNVDNPIPAVELISDSGKTYSELADGTGVSDWLGMVRHIGPGQTERGEVLFDAPAAHYKIRFSDETMNSEVLADLPLSYAHEKLNDALIPTTDLPEVTPSGAQPKK